MNFQSKQTSVSSNPTQKCKNQHFLPITRRQILDSSKLKEFADDNFKFDENGRKLSKRVENTVGKGEIVRYEQFLLFPQCFQKVCFPGVSKGVVVWEWVNKFSTNIKVAETAAAGQKFEDIFNAYLDYQFFPLNPLADMPI